MIMIIYCITCRLNGKSYVGQTITSLLHRWSEHKLDAKHGGNALLYRAIRKYGPDAFDLRVLEECHSIDELNEREQFWISELKTHSDEGYNCTDGGQGCTGFKHSEETKQHLSEVLSGRKFSEEHRRNLSESHKGRKHTEETKQKCSIAAKRRHYTDEQRARVADSNHNRIISQETREKMSQSQLGRHHTDESKLKMSNSRRGKKRKPFSDEHKQHMAEAARNRQKKQK